MGSIWVQSFGCRANQADGAALASALAGAGWRLAPTPGEADVLLLNTCTVTAAADAEARALVRRLHRRHPRGRIAVTGCYAQRAPQEVAALAGVALVAGNTEKPALVARLAEAAGAAGPATARAGETSRRPAPPAAGERTRPILKVQEGCGSRCAFCIIPSVRGAARSLPLGVVLEQAARLVAAGTREIVLSGINLGRWGRDRDGGLRLHHLVSAILERTALERLRLSSIEPMDWDDGLLALLERHAVAPQARLARHIHIPLQSGSAAVLRRMRRRYLPRHYAERVRRLHAAAPGAAIGADVMTGFPGESEAEFAETLELIAALPLTYLHVFPYSARAGTEAAQRMQHDAAWTPVAAAVAGERRRRLLACIAPRQTAFLERWVGQRLPVITLDSFAAPCATLPDRPAPHGTGTRTGVWGLSDNYLRVWIDADLPANQSLEVAVTACAGTYLRAQPVAGLAAGGGTAAITASASYA